MLVSWSASFGCAWASMSPGSSVFPQPSYVTSTNGQRQLQGQMLLMCVLLVTTVLGGDRPSPSKSRTLVMTNGCVETWRVLRSRAFYVRCGECIQLRLR